MLECSNNDPTLLLGKKGPHTLQTQYGNKCMHTRPYVHFVRPFIVLFYFMRVFAPIIKSHHCYFCPHTLGHMSIILNVGITRYIYAYIRFHIISYHVCSKYLAAAVNVDEKWGDDKFSVLFISIITIDGREGWNFSWFPSRLHQYLRALQNCSIAIYRTFVSITKQICSWKCYFFQ